MLDKIGIVKPVAHQSDAAILEVTGLTVAYNGTRALDDVSFRLEAGERVAVVGPNGAGKSTLLKVLSRILKPNRGTVRVAGRLRALIEVAAGFHTDLTGRENIFLNGAILGMSQRVIRNRLEAIVAFAGIGEFLDTPVKRYSSGMMARLGFSVAAHMDPDVLLVDEVLSVGDAAFRARCIDHMERLIRSQVSVIFISHNLEQVRRLCDRAVVLDRGAVRFEGPVDEACRQYYACFEQPAPAEIASRYPARLVSLAVLDDAGQPTHRVAAHQPCGLEVEYALPAPAETVHLTIAMLKPSALPIAGCSSALDGITLPTQPGRHRVRVSIARVPLAAGEYCVVARLVDAAANLLAPPSPLVPFSVQGRMDSHWDVALESRWNLLPHDETPGNKER